MRQAQGICQVKVLGNFNAAGEDKDRQGQRQGPGQIKGFDQMVEQHGHQGIAEEMANKAAPSKDGCNQDFSSKQEDEKQ